MAQAISSEHAWLADIAKLHDLQAQVLQQPSAFEARGISTDFEASSETNPDAQSKVEPASGATLEKLLEAETRAAEFYLASFSDDDPSTALLKASLHLLRHDRQGAGSWRLSQSRCHLQPAQRCGAAEC